MSNEPDIVRIPRPVDDTDHILGPDQAAATLVQYGDYECPHCRALHPIIRELVKRTDGLRFVYRHFPLGRFHPNAARAAQAAEAAAAQDRFWEMHDALFNERRDLVEARLDHCARQAGVDLEQYRQEMAENLYAARVDEEYKAALYGGVSGTPTLFLNELQISGVLNLEGLLESVTAAGATLLAHGKECRHWLERLHHFRLKKNTVEGQ